MKWTEENYNDLESIAITNLNYPERRFIKSMNYLAKFGIEATEKQFKYLNNLTKRNNGKNIR